MAPLVTNTEGFESTGVVETSPALGAAIVSSDTASSSSLRACLQQTGLVHTVKEWTASPDEHPGPGEEVPEIVLLDPARDFEESFAFAAHVRRLRPTVTVVLCSPMRQPDPDLLLRAMRAGVQDFLPKPVELAALQQILTRVVHLHASADKASIQKAIAVLGAKGGVGTTTVAVNLGVQLAQVSKKRVLLLDFARPLGHASLMLDLQPRFTLRDACESIDQLDSHFLSGLLVKHKSGLEVLAGTSHPDEWQRIPVSALTRLVNVAQSSFDFVLLDCGTMYSSEWHTILGPARMVLLVTEAHMPDLSVVDRHIAALHSLGLEADRVRILVNRWHRRDDEALKTVEKKLKRPVFARLPNDFRQVSEAVNVGVPLSKNHGDPLTSRYRELAEQLAGLSVAECAEKKRIDLGLLRSFFS